MANILDENFGGQPAPDLDQLLPVDPAPVNTLPKAAVRNRAAATAMLSSTPENAISNYQTMMLEDENGQDPTFKALTEQIKQGTLKNNLASVMGVLSDRNIPFEVKQSLVKELRTSELLNDRFTTLHSESLAAPSANEPKEQEDARISSSEAIGQIYESRAAIQGLVNAQAANLDSVSAKTLFEMIDLYVLPFGNNINTGILANAAQPTTFWGKIKNYLFAGSATRNLRESLANIPPDKRPEFARALLGVLSENSKTLFSSDNQFAQYDKLQSVFEDGGYSSTQEFLDNIAPLLDLIGLNQTFRGGRKAAKALNDAEKTANAAGDTIRFDNWEVLDKEVPKPKQWAPFNRQIPFFEHKLEGPKDAVKRIELNSVVRNENPASISEILQKTNPEKARSVHSVFVNGVDDVAADALAGTNREQAIINNVYPQATTEEGRISAKAADLDRDIRNNLAIDESVMRAMNDSGAIYFTPQEKAAAASNLARNFQAAEGLAAHDHMSSFRVDGGNAVVSAVYGTADGGFLKAEQAFEQAKIALRQFGIRDDEITILAKNGLDYVPVKLDEVKGIDGDYLVRVDTKYEIGTNDIVNFEKFDVKRNFFDRAGITVSDNVGSASRWFFDAASMLHPTYTGAAVVATDSQARMDKLLLSVASKFTDQVKGFSKERRAAIDDYIREANYNQIPFDVNDLRGRGFSAPEINALSDWRKFWDTHFYLENNDVVRTLNNQGYQLFRNANAELYARPIAKNQNLGQIYDPVLDRIITHSKAEGDALYQSGGTYAALRRPTVLHGVEVTHMAVPNSPTAYLRRFRDSDQVLNYRPGYFQLQYKAPRFVEQITRDTKGNITGTKAIAVAGDHAEAQRFIDRWSTSNAGEYRIRGDARARLDPDAAWDVNSAAGRIAQRHRGKLLEDGAGLNHLGKEATYVQNPAESAMRAAKSIAGRTVNRPMLEAARARFMSQYSEFLPSNGMGGRRFPNSVKEISAPGRETISEVADARTTYEYINYLENGYISSIDYGTKAVLNAISDLLGKKGLPGERAAQAASTSQYGITNLGKNAVFNAYLGLNPLRQWIVQTHQVARSVSYNPVGWAMGGVEKLVGEYIGHKVGALSGKNDFVAFLDRSGLLDAVDRNSLVRGSLLDIAGEHNSKVLRALGKAAAVPRQAGFDLGEMGNLLGHAAAVYDMFKRRGLNVLDKTVQDDMVSEIRAISYDMNFAGDMVYNQTAPAMLLQFMQVPHKAFLQATNRRIPIGTRARMVAADVVLWGVPGLAAVGAVLGQDLLPESPALREKLVWGMESYYMNAMLSEWLDDDINIDWSSLAPYDISGWGKFFQSMYAGGFQEVWHNSPAYTLVFKEGGRVREAINAMGRYFNVVEDDDESPETLLSVVNEIAKISSGWSNAVKARIMLDTKKKMDQYGSAIDSKTNNAEAIAQLFGFGTADQRDWYLAAERAGKDLKAHREETLRIYKDIKRYYSEKLEVESNDPVWITKVTGRVMKVFENDPEAMKIIQGELKKDLDGKNNQLLNLLMRRSNIPTVGGTEDLIKQAPLSDEQKQEALDRLERIKQARKERMEALAKERK